MIESDCTAAEMSLATEPGQEALGREAYLIDWLAGDEVCALSRA